MHIDDIQIDDEFYSLLRPHTQQEFEELQGSVLLHGFREKVRTWEGLLIDGHHRKRVYDNNPSIDPPEIEELEFPNREAARDWIIRNQLGRRNLTDNEYRYYIGKLDDKGDIPERTARRYSEFARKVDEIAETSGPEAKAEILKSRRVGHSTVKKIAELPPETRRDAVKKAGRRSSLTADEKDAVSYIRDCYTLITDKLPALIRKAEQCHGGPSSHSQSVVKGINVVVKALEAWKDDLQSQ